MSPAQPARRSTAAEAKVRTRHEELRALLPELGNWPRGTPASRQLSVLLDLLERKQRQLIQDNVRLAGLREITEHLLREPDEDRVLRQISLYIGHAYGLDEVLVLSRTEEGGLRGYRARAGVRGICEAIRWRPEALKGSVWEAVLGGERIEGHSIGRGPWAGPPALPVILPLFSGADEGAGSRRSEGGPVIGLLALKPGEWADVESDPLEINQVVFQAATLLDRLRRQRREAHEIRFRECLFEAMGDGLLATDSSGEVTAVNGAALALLDIHGRSLPGSMIEVLGDRAPEIVAACRNAIAGRIDSIPREVKVRRHDGQVPVGLTVVRFGQDAEEEGGGVVMTLSDLRAIRSMEEEVRRLDRLAALGRFATAVAHEIRNPLAAIGAGIDYLGQALPPERECDVALMRSEIARLDRIVRDLLEPAQMRPLQRSMTAVSSLVMRACQANEPLCRTRSVQLKVHAPREEGTDPVRVDVDIDRILQVIVNIIRNAIEATPSGSRVDIGWKAEVGSQEGASIWVLDQGDGIRPEEIGHLFEPFYSTKSSGTGLGLYVSHGVVALHGGTLSAETVAGAGARFTIRLPAPAPVE